MDSSAQLAFAIVMITLLLVYILTEWKRIGYGADAYEIRVVKYAKMFDIRMDQAKTILECHGGTFPDLLLQHKYDKYRHNRVLWKQYMGRFMQSIKCKRSL